MIDKYKNYSFPTWEDHFLLLDKKIDQLLDVNNNELKLDVTFNSVEIATAYYRHPKLVAKDINDVENNGFWVNLLISIFFGKKDLEKRKKLIRKFKTNPILFMTDSKISIIRKIGKKLNSSD